MTTHVLYKVYGAFFPVEEATYNALALAGRDAISATDDPWLFFEKDMVRFSFEGIHFPTDDICDELARVLPFSATGKLDVLDLDAWNLLRHQWKDGTLTRTIRNLNDVLEPACDYLK